MVINTFDAGVVLPDYTGPGPFGALMHTTTNINKPPDIRVDDNDIIPLRTVAHATVLFPGKLKVFPPPRRSALLNGNMLGPMGEGQKPTNSLVAPKTAGEEDQD